MMEMPGYDTYEKMYGLGPVSARMGQEDIDLAKQFQQDKLKQQQFQTTGVGLDTMFKQDSYGDRLRQGTAAADLAGYNAREQGVKTRISEGTEGLQLDAKQKQLVLDANKADLDMMELEGQRMAYSSDPKLRAQGEQMIRLHKDFIKMRDEAKIRAEEADKQRKHAFALENQRHANATSRQLALAEAKAKAGVGDEKLTTDQLRAKYILLAQQAQAVGDWEKAAMFQDQVRYITQMRASERPDTQVGKPDPAAIANIPTIQPRPPVVPPQPQGQPAQGPISRQLFPNKPQPALPPGAKQIGTSGGKPVYELNGKKYILSE